MGRRDGMLTIYFANASIAKICNSLKAARKALPQTAADKLARALTALAAYQNLGEIPVGQPLLYLHPLRGDRAGQFAVRIDAKHRMVFRPAGDFVRNADQTADLNTVVAIEIVYVGDYHD